MQSNRQVTRRAFHGSSGAIFPRSGRVTGYPEVILRSCTWKVSISVSSGGSAGRLQPRSLAYTGQADSCLLLLRHRERIEKLRQALLRNSHLLAAGFDRPSVYVWFQCRLQACRRYCTGVDPPISP